MRGSEVLKQSLYLSLSELRELLIDPLTQRLRTFTVKATTCLP